MVYTLKYFTEHPKYFHTGPPKKAIMGNLLQIQRNILGKSKLDGIK